MLQKHNPFSFEEFFWKNVDLKDKIILDAGTGFGITTSEIANRIHCQKAKSMIISIDIDPEAFKQARETLRTNTLFAWTRLSRFVAFVRADLSRLPIKEEIVDLVVSTRTLADIESFSCRVIRSLVEFYRVLKREGKVVASDECPVLSPSEGEEKVAVLRWQLAKAISHMIGRPHANEIFPEDLEYVMRLVGFRRCEWAVFKGEKIPERRINYFVTQSTGMCTKIANEHLKQAFIIAIQEVRKLFKEKGGVFPPRYIIHSTK